MMMKDLYLALAVLLAACFPAFAGDGVVRGRVLTGSGEPLEWVTVALMEADSTVVSGATTNAQGEYEMTVPKGGYTLLVSLMGFKQFTAELAVKEGGNQLSPVCLEQDVQAISAATVTGKLKIIETVMDKVVLHISQSPYAQGSDALELLSRAPGVYVNPNDQVMLNGRAVSIWFDGRPTYLDGDALKSLLRSTDGSSIEKIELIEHPSASFDAGHGGAVINIKTKRNGLEGLSGTLGLSGGALPSKDAGMTPWKESVKLSLNLRTKKTGSFLNLYQTSGSEAMKVINDFTMPSCDFSQTRSTLMLKSNRDFNVRAGSDFYLDDKNTIGVLANVSGQRKSIGTEEGFVRQWTGEELAAETRSSIDRDPERDVRYNFNLNYTHVFDADRSEEMTANFDYYHDDIYKESDMEESTLWRKTVTQDKDYYVYAARVDYQCSLWEKYKIESGAKLTLSRIGENIFETCTGRDDALSDYAYNENVSALYTSFSGRPMKKISFKAGLRAEYTDAYKKYLDLFPSVFFGWHPDDKWTLTASYNRGIGRPAYAQISPSGAYIDAGVSISGNPDILPAYSDMLSLKTAFGQHVSWTFTYTDADNVIQQVPSYGAEGGQYLIWKNNCRRRSIELSPGIVSLPVTKWLEWTLFGTLSYMEATSFQSGVTRDSWVAQGYNNLSFLFGDGWRTSLETSFSSPMDYGSYRSRAKSRTNLTVKKPLLDGKMMLSLKMNDIFKSNDFDIDYLDETGTGNVTTVKRVYYNQILLLDISWKFGHSPKAGRARKVGNLEDSSRLSDGED